MRGRKLGGGCVIIINEFNVLVVFKIPSFFFSVPSRPIKKQTRKLFLLLGITFWECPESRVASIH